VERPATRFLGYFDRSVRRVQSHTANLLWPVTLHLWIGPDELKVDLAHEPPARVDRADVAIVGYRGSDPAWRTLTVFDHDDRKRRLCQVSPFDTREIDARLAEAGWPTERATVPPLRPTSWWTTCSVAGALGWFIVEPGWLGVETPAAVGWWSHGQRPDVRIHPEPDGVAVEILAAGFAPLVAMVPDPGARTLVAALTDPAWHP
jgi:hypothetical protein